MSNIFLDLGTHCGQGMRYFMDRYNIDSSWNVHTFEANPDTYRKFIDGFYSMTPYVNAYNKAVSDHQGIVKIYKEIYINEYGTGQGSSIINLDNWNTNQQFLAESNDIECIDLSEFIIDNFSKDDFILIKMDIEGSEYDTLEKMIVDGSIDYVDDIYVEWHSRCFKDNTDILVREKKVQEELVKRVKRFENWI